MMEAKHTPGEWSYVKDEWRIGNNRCDVIRAKDGNKFTLIAIVEGTDHDGHLLAAAPNLLAAYEALVLAIEYGREDEALHIPDAAAFKSAVDEVWGAIGKGKKES